MFYLSSVNRFMSCHHKPQSAFIYGTLIVDYMHFHAGLRLHNQRPFLSIDFCVDQSTDCMYSVSANIYLVFHLGFIQRCATEY